MKKPAHPLPRLLLLPLCATPFALLPACGDDSEPRRESAATTPVDPSASPDPDDDLMRRANAAIPVAPSSDPEPLAEQPTGASVAGLRFERPQGWQALDVEGSMRAAQFRVSHDNAHADAIFFYFGERGAGSVEDNLTRWARQVTNEQGEPSLPEVREEQAGPLLITLAHYPQGAFTTTGSPTIEDARFIGVVIEGGSRGPVYIRFVGPADAVDAHESAFLAMVRGVMPDDEAAAREAGAE